MTQLVKKALIIGITGQDGSYLAELLISKGYKVYGMVRRDTTSIFENIEHIKDKIELREGDLLDELSLERIIEEINPDEVYNLASHSFVPTSWNKTIITAEINALGTVRLLGVIHKINPKIKYYQASSSEIFGKVSHYPQNETTPFNPRSPYGISKLYAHFTTINYRELNNMYAVSGILYNHESPRRGKEFVTRKITLAAARIKLGLQNELILGNLNIKRDWGFAGDYVEAMWKMLQLDEPDDFIIATGKLNTIENLLEIAFNHLDLDWKKYVVSDPKFIRLGEVENLCGDITKAKNILKWEPKMNFDELIKLMVDEDLKNFKK